MKRSRSGSSGRHGSMRSTDQYRATRMSTQESDEPRWGVPALWESSMTRCRMALAIALRFCTSMCHSPPRATPRLRSGLFRFGSIASRAVEIHVSPAPPVNSCLTGVPRITILRPLFTSRKRKRRTNFPLTLPARPRMDEEGSMKHCRLCGQAAVGDLLDLGPQPVSNRYLTSPNELEYVHPLAIGICRACGVV